MNNKTVDARGMACPLPVVNAKKASEEMTQGGILTVLVDNEIAVENLKSSDDKMKIIEDLNLLLDERNRKCKILK